MDMEMHLSLDALRELVTAVFLNNGFTTAESAVCTDEIIQAHGRGKISHGASLVPEVIDWHTPSDGPSIQRETDTSAFIMGNDTVGPVVGKRAMDLAVEKASNTGIGLVGVYNTTPFVTAGYNVRRAARQDFIGLDWCAGAPKVAVWGSKTPVIGTNPLGIGIPASDFPIVLDMAMTKIAATEIRRAHTLNEELPTGVALAQDGSDTTDPAEAMAGTMLPFGTYKGSGLGLMIDLLGGALVGGKNDDTIAGSMVFLAIKPDVFVSRSVVMDEIAACISRVETAEPRDASTDIYLPGERGERNLERARETGVEVDETIYDELVRLAE